MANRLKQIIRSTITAFFISAIVLFVYLTLYGKYVALLPISFCYVIGFVSIIGLSLLFIYIFRSDLRFAYGFGFLISIFFIGKFQSWLSGNKLTETLEGYILHRREFLGMIDPYILGNIMAIILLFRQTKSILENKEP